jgi:integration host factor subunit beta
MTRSELITVLHEKFPQYSRIDVEIIVKKILTGMELQLIAGGRIEIRGFGSFNIRLRKSKFGRNPKSGTSVYIPEKHIPRFKAGIELQKKLINI